MFSPAELESLRVPSEAAMVDRAEIIRAGARQEDEGGGYTEGAPTSTSTRCRVGMLQTATERESAGQLQVQGLEVLVVPVDTDLRNTDRVRVRFARGGSATFSVEGLIPLPSHPIDRRALVKRTAEDGA